MTVLEQVLVLAVAQEASRDETKPKVVSAVTLELSPGDAEKLDLARSVGTLSLVLRNQLDKKAVATIGVTKAELLGLKQPAVTNAPPAAQPVQVVARRVAPKPAAAMRRAIHVRRSHSQRHARTRLLLIRSRRPEQQLENNKEKRMKRQLPHGLARRDDPDRFGLRTGARRAAPDRRRAQTPALKPCTSVVVDPPTTLTLGKSRVVRLNFPVARLIVGGQAASRAGTPGGSAQPGARRGARGARALRRSRHPTAWPTRRSPCSARRNCSSWARRPAP